MGCLVRVVGLIFASLTSHMLLFLARLVFILLWSLAVVIGRLIIALSGWMLISLAALFSPRRSADAIVDRINDWLLQSGLWRLSGPGLNQVVRVLAFFGFAIGWGTTILIAYGITRWLF